MFQRTGRPLQLRESACCEACGGFKLFRDAAFRN
jgi:hypothetical protein